ncbi:ABC transporter permease [Amycolatopsis roodepoortensis]|uniref:MlaE family ABC transporter permease n=1 Tax=Amycolatopsis roodepoortensis TaxID=700274 RepID=UPI00214B3AF0|nr:ABC transporter permease [Amycolatopsis roodepoortensis]UUV28629.1 ABC transporter permease [Amycolatopsis roodepoortensis]
MTTHTAGPPRSKGRERRKASRRSGLGSAVARPLEQAGEMVQLMGKVLYSAIRHPVGYWGEVREQMFQTLKLCWLPMIISTTAFGLGAPGLQGGNIFSLFGIPERLGSFFIMASVREFAPWINAMVVAGVMGTAITADLGARRIREEIDAMEVLGVDPVRTLIVPRVIAMTLITGLMDLVALAFGVVGGYIAAVPILKANSSAFFGSFFDNATTTDIWASVLKTTIFGLIIGVVCCYKGLHTGGGPIGVGRAVNQAVVIAFAAIWIFNAVFTATMLGLNPEMQVYK